ncbi:MAG: YkgJ family cysteine cluster protein [Thermodesulfovibrionaceae bacterium]
MDEKFEIILPDGTIFRSKKESIVQGFDEEGKPKKMKFIQKTECDRCGQCCQLDTPILLKEDLPILLKGYITEKDIYTIREGEKIRSRIDGEIYDASMEMIKIKPIFGTSICLFYDNAVGCTIYEVRPTVCREFECWSQNYTITGLEKRRLTRADLFRDIEILMQAINTHEKKCSLNQFSELVEEYANGKEENFDKIVDMFLFDQAIRSWAKEKLNIQEDLLPVVFGRTLFELASLFNLIIEKEGENFIMKVRRTS